MSKPVADPRIRFANKIRFGEEPDSCWLWEGTIYPTGYGCLATKKPGEEKWGQEYAHRFSYEGFIGPIPEGLDLDHLCRVRHCVNPDHLEPVTRQENLRRGKNANREKTHCPQGHEYTPKNTHISRGGSGYWGRKCLTCTHTRDKARWQAELARRVSEGGPAK